ncbi:MULTISPECIES: 1-(5-phosphoribosyl)-5-[(5-phosphoribosylamino)methylideneamino]imidazole-4-carboxamide isomerase [Pedobacter]|jgi:phosphoribosylformimino-5-aminoimidazole carboxamide ribotide isomerase|uniref:1-(5-phosphoribosyl)-5-[(5- phosphoribosylamino)methylideneamino]imidazole-4- carboxamide isomerase n=1 Tax=Nubsella zeaxanthinifaciens TaxID=392412 RepID=UPI000DE36744|nr:1-(5-phosphoribosyl)-5-[(5-phosphoribosylamino)methylideneamino]imidazole-4-carboxamide isomerase [Nubsella zeaxanthinifaciens]
MYIIPAIDILDGKVVRLREGDYNQKTEYNVSIEDMIDQYQSNGTDFIHIIDLNGAKGDFSNQKTLFDIIKKTEMKVQYGGGIRTIEQVTNLLDAGIHRVIVGTQAISNPDFLPQLSEAFAKKDDYANRIVIAIDVLDEVIKYSGWMESSPIKLMDYVDKCLALGFFRFLCTDINKDGKLGGTAIELYQKLMDHSPMIKLIASGGVSSMADIEELAQLPIRSVVVGKAIYENRISIEEVKNWNLKQLSSI